MKTYYHKQRIIMSGIVALLLGMVPISTLSAAETSANQKSTIGVSPVNKKYDFDAGSTHKDFVTITNAGDKAFTFKVYAEPYSVKDVSYEPDFLTVKKNTDFDGWIAFEKATYTLQPRESVKAPYTVTVPDDAAPGGHYGVIFAETQPSDASEEQASLQQKYRVGTVVYANVTGEYKMGGQFTGVRIPTLQFKSPLKSELDVENTGNSHFAVETIFAVSDIFGNRKFTEEKSFEMLPQSARKIQLAWSDSPGFGLYQVTTSAKFLDQQTSKTSYVLMAPIAFYMIFAIGVLVAVIFFVQKRR